MQRAASTACGDVARVPVPNAKPGVPEEAPRAEAISRSYLHTLQLVERLNARLLEVVKDALDRANERCVNNVQALLLYHLGDRKLSAGELRMRGCYQGSNVSHNLRKLVETGCVLQERCASDHRAILVSLSPKGRAIAERLSGLFARHMRSLEAVTGIGEGELEALNSELERIERFWIDQVRFQL